MAQVAKKSVSVKVQAPKKHTKKEVLPLPKGHEVSTKEMLGKVVALAVSFSAIGNQRKIATSNVKVEADPRWIGVTKKLVAGDTIDQIRAVGAACKTYLRKEALPSLLKDGVYLIPTAYVGKVNEQLGVYAAKHNELVQQLVGEYDDVLQESRARLGKFFNPAEYPSKEGLAAAFGMSWYYVSFDVPVSLEQVNREIYQQEQAKAEQVWNEGKQVWKDLLRSQMTEIVQHLVERLSPSKDGKKKIFRDSALTNLDGFFETFSFRNIMDDEQLKAVVNKAKSLTKGLNPETLRDDEALRERTRAQFETIKNTLDSMIVLKPSREVSFSDNDA